MEQRGGADAVRALLEGEAVGELGVLQLLDAGDMLVDQRGVGQGPQVLGGLQFGRGGWQEEPMHVVGDTQLEARRFPPRPIEDQHDLLAGTGAHGARELGQLDREERDVHGRRQVEDRSPRGGMDEPEAGAPGEAVLHHRMRPRTTAWRPDAPQQRLEANAMLVGEVGRPELNGRVGERGGDLAQQRP
jgi:hypothetical protein